MEDGGFFLWLIIFAVAVLQGIGQRKKKPGQRPGRGAGPVQRSPRRRPAQIPDESVPDQPRSTTLASSSDPDPGDKEASSEGMIPSDVWEEILGLARGKPPAPKPESVPRAESPSELPSAEEEAPRRPLPERGRPEPKARAIPASHRAGAVHHRTAVTDVESRLGVVASPVQGTGREPGDGVRQELFGSGSVEELRKAIILKEVLGKPLALREE